MSLPPTPEYSPAHYQVNWYQRQLQSKFTSTMGPACCMGYKDRIYLKPISMDHWSKEPNNFVNNKYKKVQ